jgi:2-amino-4-hydroxy-6-hydroxymethyldihydropteridine diphosphokinase
MELDFHKAYLSLGSNLGDRKANIEQAIAALEDGNLRTGKVSSFYETEPVGFKHQPWYLNVALEIETTLSPLELLERCKGIEQSMGRVKPFADAPRIVDLDILLYGDRIISAERLNLPHPRLAERNFVLEPLAEIAPGLIHPVLGRSIQALLETSFDTSIVRRYGDQP